MKSSGFFVRARRRNPTKVNVDKPDCLPKEKPESALENTQNGFVQGAQRGVKKAPFEV